MSKYNAMTIKQLCASLDENISNSLFRKENGNKPCAAGVKSLCYNNRISFSAISQSGADKRESD